MAENKQYVTQTQDNGAVLISEDVIATIVAHAAQEVEGVVSLNAKPGADIIELNKRISDIISQSHKLTAMQKSGNVDPAIFMPVVNTIP